MSSSSKASAASPAIQTAHPALMVFDSDSDLRIEVGDETRKVSCDVESKALARASPVFKRMLFGTWAEAKPSTGAPWVVRLPEDDINAMAILFNIIHTRLHKVPKILPKTLSELVGPSAYCNFDAAVETDVLYLIATTADKYDLIYILDPWAKFWVERIKNKTRWNMKLWQNSWCPELLWATWLLGNRDLLYSQLNKVVLSASLTGGPAWVVRSPRSDYELVVVDSFGTEYNLKREHSGPIEILEILGVRAQLYDKRHEALKAIHDPIWSFLTTSPFSAEELANMLSQKPDYSFPFNPLNDPFDFRLEAHLDVQNALTRYLDQVGICLRALRYKMYHGSATELREKLIEVRRLMCDALGDPEELAAEDLDQVEQAVKKLLDADVFLAEAPRGDLIQLPVSRRIELWRRRNAVGIFI